MSVLAESALQPGQDPRAHARLLSRVRDSALAGATPPAAPRAVIGASWRRVLSRGLDPGGRTDVPLLEVAELERRRASSDLAPLLPLLRNRLLPTAEASGQLLVVVDASGRVLWREGGAGVRRRADSLGFVLGSAWDEDSVGTNAIGTSLVVGSPVHVYAGEHYAETHQPWTCAAAPLHDPLTGRLLGAVDLSGPASTVHPSTVALVDAVARLAELELRLAAEQRSAALREVAAPLLARLSGPALVVGADGVTAAARQLDAPRRVALPDGLQAGPAWLPAIGPCTAEPLPGGWLLRVAGPGDTATILSLDVPAGRVVVTSASGSWSHHLTPRHTEILLALAGRPAGYCAAELSTHLFGDPGRTVTVRAEMSRLRRTVGALLEHQPYRLADHVQVRAGS
jgi:hypothetical protein